MEETTSLLSVEPSDYGAAYSVTESALETVQPITLSWRDIRVSVNKGGRELLHGVSGIARPGELMALMGASGAGKTTLLNTMLARNLKGLNVQGRVEVNGNEIGREITSISGYAQQEELFVGTLTVREYLTVQARLRVNSPDKRKKRVNIVLSQLGLLKCQNTRIGVMGVKKGISGGEARRLTFACELLSNPSLLFCDEPTTGLDSFMAENVVQVLSKLAKSGRTIICTIHQPASQLYLMFDRVMFMAGGRTAFVGSPRDCISFFESCGFPCPHNYNPADLIIHTLAVVPHEEEVCKERIVKICDTFENGPAGRALIEELTNLPIGDVPEGRKRASLGSQVLALLHRSCLDNVRNPSLARAKLIQKAVMGLFIGLLYLQTPITKVGISNLNGALFYLVCELTYSTLFGILTFMPADYPLVVREYHDGIYSVFSYYFSRALSYVPLFTVDGLVMLLICYWMAGFSNSVSQVFFACLICFLIEQSSSAFGVMLSTISPSYPVAVSVAGPTLTLLSLTGGLYANVGSLPPYISWIQYLSWFRYGFEALAINQWEKVNEPNATTWTTEDRDAVLKSFSFSANNFLMDNLLMVGFIFVFYAIGYIGLSIRVRRSR